MRNLVILVVSLFICGIASACGSSTPSTPADTTPPVISGISASNIITSSATITWATDESATSQVEYGLTTNYGSITPLDSTLSTSHSINMSGLTANTAYHYRVKSDDASDNEAVSEDHIFTTATPPDITAPVISAVTTSIITTSAAIITWTTDEAATSQVEYGTTISYYGLITPLDSTLVTSHSVNLSGLTPGITYHYIVKSKDASSNEQISGDHIFSIASPVEPVEAVEIINHSSYLDTLGWYHIIGEVKNNSSNKLNYIRLTATFYNTAGTVISTDFTYTRIDTLMPEQKSPFEIILLDKTNSAAVDHYVVVLSDATITGVEPYRAFTVLSHSSSIDTSGWYHVVGEVKNTGSQMATYVQVVGTFYDATGKVVATAFTYTHPEDLIVDQVVPFEMIVTDKTLSTKIASYVLQVQC